MNPYVVINSRKRAIVALIHAVVFLFLAFKALAGSAPMPGISGLQGATLARESVLLGIYVVVTVILVYLARIASRGKETLYFAFCSTSAFFGLMRVVFGDQAVYIGLFIRVIMLICAVVTGLIILRVHSLSPLPDGESA